MERWKRLKGDLLTLYNHLKKECIQVRIRFCSQITSDKMRGNGPQIVPGGFRLGIRKIFLTERVAKPLGRTAQGSGGVTISGSVRK